MRAIRYAVTITAAVAAIAVPLAAGRHISHQPVAAFWTYEGTWGSSSDCEAGGREGILEGSWTKYWCDDNGALYVHY